MEMRKSKTDWNQIMQKACAERAGILGLVILSLIGCLVFSDMLSDFIFEKAAVYREITVYGYPGDDATEYPAVIDNYYKPQDSAFGSDVVQQKKYGFYSMEQLQDAVVAVEGVTYVGQDESEYGYAYFRLDSPRSYITFLLPVYMNTCLTMVFGEHAFPVTVSDQTGEISKFFSYGAVGSGCVKSYFFNINSCLYIYLCYIAGYLAIFVLLFFIFAVIAYFYRRYVAANRYMTQFHPLFVGMLIAGLYIGYAALQYHFHQELFQVGEGADAYYYMNPDIWDEMGYFSLEKAAAYLFTFRGYFTIIVAVAANKLSSLLGIQPIYFYFVYYGIVTAFAIVNGMPKLYQYFTGRKASDRMCLLMYAVFFLFWNNFYFYALTDIPAAMFAVLGIAWMLEGGREEKHRKVFLGSIFLGISLNYRNAYNYVLYFMILWLTAELIQKKKAGASVGIKKIAGLAGYVAAGIIVVSWPQAAINFARGHIGLFTYDGGWSYDPHSGNVISALEADLTNGLHKYNIFSKTPNKDMQLFQIDQNYYADKYYSMGDMLYIILANPLQFLMGYAKKVFWAMCIGIESAYGAVEFPYYVQIFVKLLNFYLLGNFFYLCFSEKVRKVFNVKSRLWFWGMGLATAGLQGLVHIEKRYFLFVLLLIYFANIFIFGGYLEDGKGRRQKLSCNYVVGITIFVFSAYAMEKMLEYNFV